MSQKSNSLRGGQCTSTSSRNSSISGTPLKSRSTQDPNSTTGSDLQLMPTSPRDGLSSVGFRELDLSSPLCYGTPGNSTPGRTPRGTGTPIRRRPDLGVNLRVRTVDMTPDRAAAIQVSVENTPASQRNDRSTQSRLVIWGTDVNINECKDKFSMFVNQFIGSQELRLDRNNPMDVTQAMYMQKLMEISVTEEPFLDLNCDHLKNFDAILYRQLICYPQEVIPAFDMAINEIFFTKYPDIVLEHQIQVRPYNAERTKNMRFLNPKDIDQLITVSGMVIRTSTLIPEMRQGLFHCSTCRNEVTVEIERGRILEPSNCTNCSAAHSMTLVHNRSIFTDKQLIKLQEEPDDMPAGQTPHSIVLHVYSDLVDAVDPGDRVVVTGVYRAQPFRENPRMRTVKSVHRTYVDILHFERKQEGTRKGKNDDDDSIHFTDQEIADIKNLSQRSDLYDILGASIAPSIYESQDVKKGILLQLFGGTTKDLASSGRKHLRDSIHILLCGDPGTSKSQLLQYVYKIVPRSQYTSGKGSSAVGLTAYVTKDPDTRQLVLQPGALVLSDNGVCCIDEFDKMSDTTKSVLHEVMEQQTLSIAKAGIICQLNARTSVLAAANPVESQWNHRKTIIDNIMLPHTLLSRFDLIFLILDSQDEAFDRRLASHLVSLYHQGIDANSDSELLDMSVLRKYLNYARTYIKPRLSDEATQSLIHAYVSMRKVGSGTGKVTAYPRQLESLIRLAEAHAKVRLSSIVEDGDVQESLRLYQEAIKQSATDPRTGIVDISILTTGMSATARKRFDELKSALKTVIEVEKAKMSAIRCSQLLEKWRSVTDQVVTRPMFDEVMQSLQEDEFIVRTNDVVRFC